MMTRRAFVRGSLLAGPALWGLRARAEDRGGRLQDELAALERRYGGRLGVAVLDTAGGPPIAHRGAERFPLCSTFKVLAAAFVLSRVDAKAERLDRRVVYEKGCLVAHSPVTEQHAGAGGLTVGEICEAAITLSDNTAGNLMLDSFGGPAALTTYLQSLGDTVSRLDRRETELNEARPGDPRDTTSPIAMVTTLRTTLLGDALSASSRGQLTGWLVANKTGDKRLRAGVPTGWRVGDKTGTGERNATNDLAVIWPPGRAPILVVAYYVEARATDEDRNAVIAEVGRLATAD